MNIKHIFYFIFFSSTPFVSGFQWTPHKSCRRIKLLNAIAIKRNQDVISETKESVSTNMYAIIKDDLSNDLLYYMRFYHLTNDDQISYFYIVFYEFLSFMIKSEQRTMRQIHISMLNVTIYILLKNIIINHYIHHT